MKLSFIILALTLFSLAPATNAGDLYGMIMEGRIAEASDSLSRLATASTRDGNLIFMRSLIEADADKAASLMETSLKSSLSHGYRQQVYYRLGYFYLMKKDYRNLSRIVSEYRSSFEAGRFEQEMLRLSVLLDQLQGNHESALKQADRYAVRFSKGEADQWGQVDRARIMFANKKRIGGIKLLRKLSRGKSDIGVPQALYMLAKDATVKNRTEDAVFYYNLLREAYPLAIGLEDITDDLSTLSDGYKVDNSADQITGTYYSVKVGVFAKKANAKNFKRQFEDLGQKVDIVAKAVFNKKHYVVLVGHFASYEQALEYKKNIEATQGDVYQVVPR